MKKVFRETDQAQGQFHIIGPWYSISGVTMNTVDEYFIYIPMAWSYAIKQITAMMFA